MAERQAALAIYEDRPSGPAIYLRLFDDGTATGYNGHVDLGTGIETALAQIVAEELDLPLASVRIELGHTATTPDQGPTIASEQSRSRQSRFGWPVRRREPISPRRQH